MQIPHPARIIPQQHDACQHSSQETLDMTARSMDVWTDLIHNHYITKNNNTSTGQLPHQKWTKKPKNLCVQKENLIDLKSISLLIDHSYATSQKSAPSSEMFTLYDWSLRNKSTHINFLVQIHKWKIQKFYVKFSQLFNKLLFWH